MKDQQIIEALQLVDIEPEITPGYALPPIFFKRCQSWDVLTLVQLRILSIKFLCKESDAALKVMLERLQHPDIQRLNQNAANCLLKQKSQEGWEHRRFYTLSPAVTSQDLVEEANYCRLLTRCEWRGIRFLIELGAISARNLLDESEKKFDATVALLLQPKIQLLNKIAAKRGFPITYDYLSREGNYQRLMNRVRVSHEEGADFDQEMLAWLEDGTITINELLHEPDEIFDAVVGLLKKDKIVRKLNTHYRKAREHPEAITYGTLCRTGMYRRIHDRYGSCSELPTDIGEMLWLTDVSYYVEKSKDAFVRDRLEKHPEALDLLVTRLMDIPSFLDDSDEVFLPAFAALHHPLIKALNTIPDGRGEGITYSDLKAPGMLRRVIERFTVPDGYQNGKVVRVFNPQTFKLGLMPAEIARLSDEAFVDLLPNAKLAQITIVPVRTSPDLVPLE